MNFFPDPPPLKSSNLCLACKSIFDPTSARDPSSNEVAHHGLEALAIRATRGCHLCLTVYMAIDPDAFKNFREKARSVGFAGVSPIGRDQAKLRFRYLGPLEAGGGRSKAPTRPGTSSGLPVMSAPGSSHGSSDEGSWASGGDDGRLVVELMMVNPRYAVEPGVRTLPAQAVSTGSPDSLKAAQTWLHDCSFNHMKCSVSDGNSVWKPSHLLDVTIKGPKGAPGVKLVDGIFLDSFTEYVTLSHCWGRGKTIRLTKKTLPSLRQGVAASHLPKTFADAAEATDKLGFRYLWIDALCIMHDDEQAVLGEIAQMHKVYSEASLNLAATSARDDSGGLFCERNVEALQPPVIDVRGQGIVDGVYKVLRSTVWRDLVDSSPLSKRAWVFQERCLAKRTLHFTRNEVLWECQQASCSEVFPKGLPADLTSQSSPSDQSRYSPFNKRYFHQRTGNWSELVRMYTRGRLTYSSDKLLAMSGLARQYMTRNRLRDPDYIAGLWRPQLPHALLWRVEEGRAPSKYRAPSWSWASLDGRVSYPDNLLLPQVGGHQESCVEILEVQIKAKSAPTTTTTNGANGRPVTSYRPPPSLSHGIGMPQSTPNNPFGLLDSAALKLRGFLIRGLLRRTHDYWGRTPCVVHVPSQTLPSLHPQSAEHPPTSQPQRTQPLQIELETSHFDTRLPPLSAPTFSHPSHSTTTNLTESLEIYLLPLLDTLDTLSGLILTAYSPPLVPGAAKRNTMAPPAFRDSAAAVLNNSRSTPDLLAAAQAPPPRAPEKRKGEYRRIGTWEVSRYDVMAWEGVRGALGRGIGQEVVDGRRERWEERVVHPAAPGGAGGGDGGRGGQGQVSYVIWLV